jgi:hypothetical protein
VIARCIVLVFAASAVNVRAADSLADAQALFYNGRFVEANAVAQALSADRGMLAIYELRTAVLHFQIRGELGTARDRTKAYNECRACPEQFELFMRDLRNGQALARTTLGQNPTDTDALFFLGKLDLNYVWLMLGTLGRKTGWNEFHEARRSLETLLAQEPQHLRARVALAWIEYIVDTRMPWGTAWLLGGGNKRKAVLAMHEAAESRGEDFYASAEATFGLWDMEAREGNIEAALLAARRLASAFPSNRDVASFIDRHRGMQH